MSAKEITRTSALAVFLYVVYFLGSFVDYIELVSFIILVYGTTLKTRVSYFAVVVFTLIVMLTKGIGPWSIMYLVVFPQYILLYSFVANITKNRIVYFILAGILSFLLGTFIELPYLLTGGLYGKALLLKIFMGFQVSIGNVACTVVAAIFLYEPFRMLIRKTLGSDMIKKD
ncbi:hypothetical protein [uncultured Clostridium sp.]|jgi:hypothetical protein|uniref:hypothetical protein n=1 Tax=uncultured Clostridium sp. TaxID=59620 RepID=UPI0026105F40|nr:hypothetical protein [uncultured Clostridium sp.]